MRKRERENPCGVCGHYHKYEEGEVCGICGHRASVLADNRVQTSCAFPSEILKGFLYLGSYDNASRSELLKALGISRILNTVPACQNLYKTSFTYHCLQDGNSLQFDDAIQFLEQCSKDKACVLVHCMSGKNRSPAIVIAYLMKSRQLRLDQSLQWVKDRRPVVDISPAVYQQLVGYEKKLFDSNPLFTFSSPLSGFNVRFPSHTIPPVFNQTTSASIFGKEPLNIPPTAFAFGSGGKNEPTMLDNNIFSIAPSTGTEAAPTDRFPSHTIPSVFNQTTSASIFGKEPPNIPPTAFVFGSGGKNEPTMLDNNTFSVAPSTGTEGAPMDSF